MEKSVRVIRVTMKQHGAGTVGQISPFSLDSGWRETHSGCKFSGLAAASLKFQKVLIVVLGLRFRAFFNFASPRSNLQIFALKALSRQPLDKLGLWFVALLVIGGCHPRPVQDIVLADVALKSAQKVKADSLASDQYRKAENYFIRAKKDFADGYFDSSRKFANEARMAAERAEYQAIWKSTQIKGKGSANVPPAPEYNESPYEEFEEGK